uniref:Uncharacterized protein n=1 Tax=Caenorhabditis japonica TaxID=281687 RepID=A0A8R1EHH8_CAEJA
MNSQPPPTTIGLSPIADQPDDRPSLPFSSRPLLFRTSSPGDETDDHRLFVFNYLRVCDSMMMMMKKEKKKENKSRGTPSNYGRHSSRPTYSG